MASSKGKQGRRWCFTINNWCDADVERLKKVNCKYMVVGVEVGENGTPHLQGYVRLAKPTRFNTVKKLIGVRAHIEAARGTEGENDEYCRKDGVIALEKGTMNPEISAKGCKAQCTETIHKLIGLRLKGVSPVTIAASDDVACYYRYERMIEKTVAKFAQEKNVLDLKATYTNTNWRLWQLKLLEYVQKDPDARKVVWFVDEKGNSGKTYVTKYLLTEITPPPGLLTRSRTRGQYIAPKCRINAMVFSFYPRAIRIWNMIPSKITNIKNPKSFQEAIMELPFTTPPHLNCL